jgi:hypothetical protein
VQLWFPLSRFDYHPTATVVPAILLGALSIECVEIALNFLEVPDKGLTGEMEQEQNASV